MECAFHRSTAHRSGWGTHGVRCSGGGVGNRHGGGLIHCRTNQDMHNALAVIHTPEACIPCTFPHSQERPSQKESTENCTLASAPPHRKRTLFFCGCRARVPALKQSMVAGYARDWKDCFKSTNLAISANMSAIEEMEILFSFSQTCSWTGFCLVSRLCHDR